MLYGNPPFPHQPNPKPPAEQALSQIRQALKGLCPESALVYMMETKKLYLGIIEAFEMLGHHRRRNLPHDQAEILRNELRNQLMAFAILHLVNDDQAKKAAKVSTEGWYEAANQSPPISRTALMLRELEACVESTPDNEAVISRWLMNQPLFQLFSQTPELFTVLEQHYPECAPGIPQILKSTNETVASLMKSGLR
jgi:hypothetical protein